MTDRHQRQDRSDEPTIPSGLAEDLAELYRPPIEVPREVDDGILFAARRRFGDTRRSHWWGAIGTAAAIVFVVFLVQHALRPPAPTAGPPEGEQLLVMNHRDVDGSGRVDILDAFALARQLKSGGAGGEHWDVNGDGRVDRADVDAIAMTAVRLVSSPLQGES